MTIVLAWLSQRFATLWTKLIVVGGVVLAGLLVALQLISIGRGQERARQAADADKAIRDKSEIDHEAHDKSDADLDVGNTPWLRR